jgi:hypothetical protein
LIPHHDIGLDEDCTWLGRVFINELLRFWTQAKVGNHDIAMVLK